MIIDVNIAGVHPVHMMNQTQCQVATNPLTRPTDDFEYARRHKAYSKYTSESTFTIIVYYYHSEPDSSYSFIIP